MMEKCYPAAKFKCTVSIPLKEYFSKFNQTYEQELFIQSEDNTKLAEELQLDRILDWSGVFGKQKRCELKQLCSLIKSPTQEMNITEKGKRVKTTKEITNDIYWIRSLRKKIKNPACTDICHDFRRKRMKIEKINPGTEFVVNIRVYKPFYKNSHINSQSTLKFQHEIVILASQTLADLRDKILCINDRAIFSEVKSPTDRIPRILSRKVKYSSGFFFINDAFYNDMRKKEAVDYSERLINWANKHGIDSILTAEMTKTRIGDLTIKFGYPYIYFHQGRCEHNFIFSSASLLTAKNTLNKKAYPYYKSGRPFITKHCNYCKKAAKWICNRSTFLPFNRTLLCQNCALDLTQKNSTIVGEHKLYCMPDESLLFDDFARNSK